MDLVNRGAATSLRRLVDASADASVSSMEAGVEPEQGADVSQVASNDAGVLSECPAGTNTIYLDTVGAGPFTEGSMTAQPFPFFGGPTVVRILGAPQGPTFDFDLPSSPLLEAFVPPGLYPMIGGPDVGAPIITTLEYGPGCVEEGQVDVLDMQFTHQDDGGVTITSVLLSFEIAMCIVQGSQQQFHGCIRYGE